MHRIISTLFDELAASEALADTLDEQRPLDMERISLSALSELYDFKALVYALKSGRLRDGLLRKVVSIQTKLISLQGLQSQNSIK